jgi:hypothetical protein
MFLAESSVVVGSDVIGDGDLPAGRSPLHDGRRPKPLRLNLIAVAVAVAVLFQFVAHCYQPRSARRWGSGMSSTLMPTIASPSPRETFAMTSGSS